MDARQDGSNRLSRRDAARVVGFAGLGMLFGNALFAPAARADAPAIDAGSMQGAGFYDLKIGDAGVTLVSDGGFAMAPASLFPETGAEAIATAARDAFVSPEAVPGHVNGLLIRVGGATILVDAGCGTNFGPTAGMLERNLARAGVRPADVTHVVVTHAHPDHIGGLVDADGRSRFGNARVILSPREHAFWMADRVEIPGSLVPAEMVAGMAQGAKKTLDALKAQVTLVEPGQTVVDGVTLVDAPGHTPGHLALRVESAGEALVYLTDAVHVPALQLANPDWHVSFDTDPVLAAATRRALLDQAAADRTLVAGAHLPFPGFGYVVAEGRGYRWTPRVWEW